MIAYHRSMTDEQCTRVRAPAAVAVAATIVLASCAPEADAGECGVSDPCPRGFECNLDTAECLALEIDTSSTETPAPASFSRKAIPFFRGRVCTVVAVQAGAPFPVWMSPCLHPCLSVNQYQYTQSWSCVGSHCEGIAVMVVEASSVAAGCPADAFGLFDPALCEFSTPVDFTISPVYTDGTPIQGELELEVPFLDNADAAAIVAAGNDLATIQARVEQYPRAPERIVSGGPISLLGVNPPPPESCGDNGDDCECFTIGP